MRYWLTLCAIGVALDGSAQTTADAANVLRWTLTVPDADFLVNEARTYRLYENPHALTVTVAIPVDDDSPVSTTSIIEEIVSFQVDNGQPVPISVEWLRSAGNTGRVLPPANLPQGTLLRHAWRALLRRTDGRAFEPARYRIRAALDKSSLRTASGDPWAGRLMPAESTVWIVTGGPSASPMDRAAASRQVGRKAYGESRFSDAIKAYRAAVTAHPEDQLAWSRLGDAYLRVADYGAAIESLQMALALMPPNAERYLGPLNLALAFIGAGDEARARRTLLDNGWAPSRVEEEVAVLRKRLSTRKE